MGVNHHGGSHSMLTYHTPVKDKFNTMRELRDAFVNSPQTVTASLPVSRVPVWLMGSIAL